MEVRDNYFDTNILPDYCEEANLMKFYDAFVHNLKNSPYKTRWISPFEIEPIDPYSWVVCGDKYLINSEDDWMKLAMNVYNNGTYFPIFVLGQPEKEYKYKLRDGIHRFYCMRKLIELGYWKKNKKIMVATDELVDWFKGTDEREFLIPMTVNNAFKKTYRQLYEELASKGSIVYSDESKMFAVLKTRNKGFLAVACLSLLLRNAFFDYEQLHGKSVKSSPYMNNHEAWLEWRGY